jgi:hypothetical protein
MAMNNRVRKNLDFSSREAEVLAQLAQMMFSGDPQRTYEFIGFAL